jgi:hypothetical protein
MVFVQWAALGAVLRAVRVWVGADLGWVVWMDGCQIWG